MIDAKIERKLYIYIFMNIYIYIYFCPNITFKNIKMEGEK